MKKLFILLLALILVCSMCSCGLIKNVLNLKNNFEFPLPSVEITAAPEDTEYTTDTYYETTFVPVETTVAETEPEPEVIPEVITENNYQKAAIDAFFPGEKFDFIHQVEYPRINSDKSGAAAINAKIAERYEKIITELKGNNEGNVLYHITYTSSECNGIIFIRVLEQCGWQYSEGYTSQKFFYYDVANDKELSLDEYLAAFNVDRNKLDAGICSSYELSLIMYEESPYLTETVGGEPLGAPATDTLYYATYESYAPCAEFDGAEFIGGEKPVIRAYLMGGVYIASPYTCDVYADNYLPVTPNYAGYSMPAGANESNDIIVLFDGGKVISLSAPSKYDIQSINYSSSEIKVISKNNIRDSRISINGCEPYSWGSGELGGTEEEKLFIDTYSVQGYIPIDELKSIIITVIEE